MMYHRFRNVVRVGFVFVAGLAALLRAEDYAISTFAGTSNVSGGADGQPGSFSNPYGIAIDAAKNLYVTWDPLESTCRHASLSIL